MPYIPPEQVTKPPQNDRLLDELTRAIYDSMFGRNLPQRSEERRGGKQCR